MELVCVVVVPARNEQQRIAGCLQALAGQELPLGSFETIVVIDDCCDATEEVAARTAAALGLTV